MNNAPEANDLTKSLFEMNSQELLKALAIPGNKRKLDWITVRQYSDVLLSQTDDMEEKYLIIQKHDCIIRTLNEPDPFTKNTILEMDIPSGKIVTADSLFAVVPDLEGYHSINHGEHLDKFSRKLHQKTGLAYIFAGDSSPNITKDKNSVVKIVNFELDDNDQDILINGEETVAQICTDLWAVSMIDHDKWVSYGGGKDGKPNEKTIKSYQVFEVVPGKYRLTIHSHQDDFELYSSDRVELATMELVKAY